MTSYGKALRRSCLKLGKARIRKKRKRLLSLKQEPILKPREGVAFLDINCPVAM
ncbi:hypothetical protein [Synechococcus sp. M16CYN]|uniref:hypothetical protein n=1 Tax=Synechococcus sp. M16CYN TaxID=3103139 RepID=UPI003340F8C9